MAITQIPADNDLSEVQGEVRSQQRLLVSDNQIQHILSSILTELKIQTIHYQTITDEEITSKDIPRSKGI